MMNLEPARIVRFHAVVVVLLASGLAGGCRKPAGPATAKHAREVMGTFAEVTAVAATEPIARAAVDAAYAALDRVNNLMSDYVPDSEVGRLNALAGGESLAVSPETFAVLTRAREFAEATGGAFDVTYRPLKEVWKQAGKAGTLPPDSLLEETRLRVGYDKLRLDPATRTVTPTIDGLQVDLGGIAKGYGLDLAAQAALDAGATAVLVNVGGDVLAIGTQASGQPWRIGVKHPFIDGLAGRLALTGPRAVATSGIQQRFTVIDGKRYSHIIDPRTGRPAEQAPSVTVIAPDGITADAWATVFSILTVEEGRTLAASLADVEAMWIWGSAEQMNTAQTDGFSQYVLP
jgi:thiamine biosynthesis lipoprotein